MKDDYCAATAIRIVGCAYVCIYAECTGSNEGKRYYGERERERRGGRGKTTIIPRVSNQIDEMIDACAPY